MDFSAHQEAAKKRTLRLLLLYAAMVLSFSLLAGAFLDWSILYAAGYPGQGLYTLPIAALILAVIAVLSLFSPAGANSGGKNVAEALGARLVSTPQNNLERRLVNVVEEMALASGMPVPPVYILDKERGINAFAAGASINSAVIGVTSGALEHLNRDELQAVAGHEFSHILNGDMRMNMRFARLLFGLMILAAAGHAAIRGMSRVRIRGRNGKNTGGAIAVILLLALVCFVFGHLTSFMGSILQAAINRQREFLADASAVQFTRSPAIASALKKIAESAAGSKLGGASMCAASYRHLFFSQSSSGIFNSHPPLFERIKRIESNWAGVTPKAPSAALPAAGAPKDELRAPLGISAAQEYREANLDKCPALERLQFACREPLDACGMMFALLLGANATLREKQLAMLPRWQNRNSVLDCKKNFDLLGDDVYARLIELAAPALKTLSAGQYGVFRDALHGFIFADEEFTFREWVLFQVVESVVGAQFGQPESAFQWGRLQSKSSSIGNARRVETFYGILSTIARLHENEELAAASFSMALRPVDASENGAPHIYPRQSLAQLGDAMRALQNSSKKMQDCFLGAAGAIIEYDGRLDPQEEMLMRMLSLCLGRPFIVFKARETLILQKK